MPASPGAPDGPPGGRCRNPANGQTIQIAASKKLGFSAAKALKDRLNG